MPKSKNILFITADQWRGECLSSLGHRVQTPNLDRLAGDSVLFRQHYANAVPCAPSRASLHTGMYLQTLALLAEERGWGTCMQECWGILRPMLKEHFGLGQSEMVWCGMAVGIPDADHPVNSLRAERADIDEIAEFKGF